MSPRCAVGILLSPACDPVAEALVRGGQALIVRQDLRLARLPQFATKCLGQRGRNRVPDLTESMAACSCEPEAVRKRLDPGRFSHTDGSLLGRMDVPVSVLRNMRSDAPREVVPR